MTRPLHILAPTRYPWRFNGPRASRHHIHHRVFAPLNKLSPAIEGFTFFNPLPLQRFDLIHAFNRIPLGITPYIIGFESHLPRGFGVEHTALFRAMARSLAGSRCRGIIAISHYARRQCLHQHQHAPWAEALAAKLTVRYPNLPLPATPPAVPLIAGAPMRLVFVGNHFARKGGLVAVRMAELAQARGLPLEITLISALEVGTMSWTDPLQPGYLEPYRALIERLPNITLLGALPNAQVIEHVARAHFVLLPTFSDSFGFSAIEAMAHGTPVIATTQGALPEFITDGHNGLLLPLAVDARGEWVHISTADRTSTAYAQLVDETVQDLAEAALARLAPLLHQPAAYAPLRTHARHTATSLFASTDATLFWDDFYTRST